jgi:hypothetical protein
MEGDLAGGRISARLWGMTPPQPPVTGGRSWPYALGAVLFLVLAGIAVVPSTDAQPGDRAYMIGAFFGATVVGTLVVLGLVWLFRARGKARTAVERAKVAFWSAAVILTVQLARTIQSTRADSANTTFSSLEREGLKSDADSLWHPLLGFSLPHPGPSFVESPELREAIAKGFEGHPDIIAWGFMDGDRQQMLMVQVSKIARLNEVQFRSFARGVKQGVSASSQLVGESTTWNQGAGEYQATLTNQNGHLELRCLGHDRSPAGVIVCAQTAGTGPDNLAWVRGGLHFDR